MGRPRNPSKTSPAMRGAPADWDIPRVAYLYRDSSSPVLEIDAVAGYLQDTVGIPCTVRRDFFAHHTPRDLEGLARRIAATRVRNIMRPFEPMEPVYGEVQFELRLLEEPSKRVPGILYDAYRYTGVMRDLLPTGERSLRVLHIAFEHRILGTFEEDGRYHAHTVVCVYPSVVSTSGIVEAPAKPEAYYKVKAQLSIALGAIPFDAAKEPFKGQFIDYDDSRLTEVAKGYALQAAMYHITREAFCDDPECRLFNAHRQAELIRAQLGAGRLCSRHKVFRASHSLPYPLLSDWNKTVSRAYGVLYAKLGDYEGVSKRSVFVLDREGVVRYRWVTEDPKVPPDENRILEEVRRLAST